MIRRNNRTEISNPRLTEQPLFSIVITTYNRAALLKRALNSLIHQTNKDWEAIIVDDGSTDDTHTQALHYLTINRSFRYVWKPHSGPYLSMNHGIRTATGKYVTFLGSDDEYHPTHLELRKNFLIENPEAQFLHGGVQVLGNPYVPDKNDPSERINLDECYIGGSFFIERELLLSMGGFRDIVLGSDSDLFERAERLGVSMAKIKNPTYIYHHENQDSITNRLYRKINDPDM